MVKKFSLPAQNRLKYRRYFNFIFENGKKNETTELVIWHINSIEYANLNEKGVKFGIIVSRKYGNSVKRNRLKRLIKEAFRMLRQKIKDGSWLIIYTKPECNIKKLKDAIDALNKILKKAEIIE